MCSAPLQTFRHVHHQPYCRDGGAVPGIGQGAYMESTSGDACAAIGGEPVAALVPRAPSSTSICTQRQCFMRHGRNQRKAPPALSCARCAGADASLASPRMAYTALPAVWDALQSRLLASLACHCVVDQHRCSECTPSRQQRRWVLVRPVRRRWRGSGGPRCSCSAACRSSWSSFVACANEEGGSGTKWDLQQPQQGYQRMNTPRTRGNVQWNTHESR